MDELTRLQSFLDDVRPVCIAIQAKMTPLRKALGHLYQLGDDDNPKLKLQSFGAEFREAVGPVAAKSLTIDLQESAFQPPENAHLCRLLLRDAVTNEWNRLHDLLTNYPECTQYQALNSLHNMVYSSLHVRERHLQLSHVSAIENSLQKHELSPCVVTALCKDRLGTPPYIESLLEMAQQREVAAIQIEVESETPAAPSDVMQTKVKGKLYSAVLKLCDKHGNKRKLILKELENNTEIKDLIKQMGKRPEENVFRALIRTALQDRKRNGQLVSQSQNRSQPL